MANAPVHQRQRSRRRSVALVVPLLVLALFAAACGGSDEPEQVASDGRIPTDVADTCQVEDTTFDSWFNSGEPSVDGAVTAANSVGFPTNNTVCDFYTWGAQMFLWLTSPEGEGLVLDGPSIFTVSPEVNSVRTLIANTDDGNLELALRAEKIGELAQAGSSGVLMSQGRSLVYYGVHVNDVYAYFLTGKKGGAFSNATVFPRNQDDLDEVLNYVDTTFPGVTIDNPDALTMEMKTSWVDASKVGDDIDQFVTIVADVPEYNETSDSTWTPTGNTVEMTLALTGVHIVGTVQNHPEFIWITYEHMANAPFADYLYTDSGGKTVERTFDTTNAYLFRGAGGTVAESNGKCMTASTDNTITGQTVDGKCDGDIEPSDTYSMFPWGSPSSDTSDGTTEAVVENNTRLLSLNNSVIDQLGIGDVRQNYIQTGGIWTTNPGGTGDAPIPGQPGYEASDLRGSLKVFNTTMETYAQNSSCFSCHNGESFGDQKLSHIYFAIEPLELPG